jgi:hypothetical protein
VNFIRKNDMEDIEHMDNNEAQSGVSFGDNTPAKKSGYRMSLTNTVVRDAKGSLKPYKLFDGRGLYVLVNPTGTKWWRFKYRWRGKEKLLSLGIYPEVSLSKARGRRDTARRLITTGTNPSDARRSSKEANLARERKLKLSLESTNKFLWSLRGENDNNRALICLLQSQHESLYIAYEKLGNKFESNFKFHGYIKDVLDQTADLMENYNVRK